MKMILRLGLKQPVPSLPDQAKHGQSPQQNGPEAASAVGVARRHLLRLPNCVKWTTLDAQAAHATKKAIERRGSTIVRKPSEF